ncbi:MAG: membrane protein [Candidatus Micrarchaeota archaeon]|nr:MAG: membrane protein [Candidatus Micrarchaeota archaeon]
MTFFTLDKKGTAAALLMGFVIFLCGYLAFSISIGLILLLSLFEFLVLSYIVTEIGSYKKKKAKLYQKSRGLANVIGNGLTVFLLSIILVLLSNSSLKELIVFSMIASVAGITSDKFSSELAVLYTSNPIDILTFKRVEKGTSGGVTAVGFFFGYIGSFIIGLDAYALSLIFHLNSAYLLVLLISLAGFIGNIADSIAGHFEERGYGNKFTSNFICSLISAIFGYIFALIAI